MIRASIFAALFSLVIYGGIAALIILVAHLFQ